MKLSKQILSIVNENSENLFKQNLISSKRTPWLKEAIQLIEDGEKNKLIYNADFEESKSRIKGIMYHEAEAAQETGALKFPVPPEYAERWRVAKIYTRKDNPLDAFREIAKYEDLKDLKAMKFFKDEFVEPLVDLYMRLMELKPYIQKGRKPNLAKKEKEQVFAPMTKHQDVRKVKELYDDLLKEWYPAQVASLIEYYTGAVKTISGFLADTKGDAEARKGIKYLDGEVISAFFEIVRTDGAKEIVVRKDLTKLIKEYAERSAKEIQQQFVSKNVRKITAIVASKNNLTNVKLDRVSKAAGKLEGIVSFEFADNTSFSVNSQVVSVYNSRAKSRATTYFVRFPTTFHNVVFPDGKKHAKRSELEMVRDFAGIKQP